MSVILVVSTLFILIFAFFREYLVQYNRENRIFEKDDTPLWELSHLSLSYKNIIEIDNLLGLDKLKRL